MRSLNVLPGASPSRAGGRVDSARLGAVHRFDVEGVRRRLVEENGGYEAVHESAGLEVGVYVLVAPEADRQQPHADDEIYIGLEGTGVLQVEGEEVPIREGEAIFVEAGADHRFTAYESLSVLVIFERAQR
jgi:mannose-6-phosphate isomerase-like protein (cupin superfamily)